MEGKILAAAAPQHREQAVAATVLEQSEPNGAAAAAPQQSEPKGYDAVVAHLRDGYGPSVACALLTCIERYLYATDALDMCPGKWDADNMWQLCQLLKCILKDEFGADLEG